MYRVSVLMPVRNAEATIARAVNSLWAQSMKDFELVVVNDGSSDETAQFLHDCNDSRIKITEQPPLGIAAALNNGLKHCTASLIARMDADDYAMPDRLQKQYDFFQQHPEVDVLASRVTFEGNAEKSRGYVNYINEINNLMTHHQMWARRFWDAPLAHPSVMFRKHVVEQAGGYNEDGVPEDFDMWLRLFHGGYRFARVPESLIIWTDTPGRLSRSHKNYDKRKFWELKARYFAKWLKQEYGQVPPDIYIWGETSRNQRSRFLLQEEVKITGYIHNSTAPPDKEWIPYKDVPDLKGSLILIYVSNREGKRKITDFLDSHHFTDGKDYFVMV